MGGSADDNTRGEAFVDGKGPGTGTGGRVMELGAGGQEILPSRGSEGTPSGITRPAVVAGVVWVSDPLRVPSVGMDDMECGEGSPVRPLLDTVRGRLFPMDNTT